MFKKPVIYIIFIFINNSCLNSKSLNNNRYFKLIQANKQSWTAGIETGGSGIDYSFQLIIKTNQNISFDSVWINNKAFKLITTKRRIFISNEPITFSRGDTILIKSSESTNSKHQNIITSPPIEYNGAALIGYYYKNNRGYCVVKNIELSSPVYYQ